MRSSGVQSKRRWVPVIEVTKSAVNQPYCTGCRRRKRAHFILPHASDLRPHGSGFRPHGEFLCFAMGPDFASIIHVNKGAADHVSHANGARVSVRLHVRHGLRYSVLACPNALLSECEPRVISAVDHIGGSIQTGVMYNTVHATWTFWNGRLKVNSPSMGPSLQ